MLFSFYLVLKVKLFFQVQQEPYEISLMCRYSVAMFLMGLTYLEK